MVEDGDAPSLRISDKNSNEDVSSNNNDPALISNDPAENPVGDASPELTRWQELKGIVVDFWPLGLIAFGGPAAHIALLRERFVQKKKTIDEDTFVELFG